MSSRMVIYAVGQEAAADTYLAWCTPRNPDLVYDPNATWYPSDAIDVHGQRIVAYFGPGGRADITEEPAGGPVARGVGVIQDDYDHPPVEE